MNKRKKQDLTIQSIQKPQFNNQKTSLTIDDIVKLSRYSDKEILIFAKKMPSLLFSNIETLSKRQAQNDAQNNMTATSRKSNAKKMGAADAAFVFIQFQRLLLTLTQNLVDQQVVDYKGQSSSKAPIDQDLTDAKLASNVIQLKEQEDNTRDKQYDRDNTSNQEDPGKLFYDFDDYAENLAWKIEKLKQKINELEKALQSIFKNHTQLQDELIDNVARQIVWSAGTTAPQQKHILRQKIKNNSSLSLNYLFMQQPDLQDKSIHGEIQDASVEIDRFYATIILPLDTNLPAKPTPVMRSTLVDSLTKLQESYGRYQKAKQKMQSLTNNLQKLIMEARQLIGEKEAAEQKSEQQSNYLDYSGYRGLLENEYLPKTGPNNNDSGSKGSGFNNS